MVPKEKETFDPTRGYCATEYGPCWRTSSWRRGPFFDFTIRKRNWRTIRVEIKGYRYAPCAVLGFWQTHFPSSVVPFGWCYHGLYDSYYRGTFPTEVNKINLTQHKGLINRWGFPRHFGYLIPPSWRKQHTGSTLPTHLQRANSPRRGDSSNSEDNDMALQKIWVPDKDRVNYLDINEIILWHPRYWIPSPRSQHHAYQIETPRL